MKFKILTCFIVFLCIQFRSLANEPVSPVEELISIKWLEPTTRGKVGQYEKLELQVILPSRINQEIQNFLDEREGTAQINPFNPEEIDVKAEFWVKRDNKWFGPELKYGFFYNEFERDTSSANIEEWGWEMTSGNEMRIRFAPSYTGMWRCKISVLVNNKELHSGQEFTFECVRSHHDGYMQISSNQRNFELNYECFTPMGVNLGHPRWIDDPNKLRQGTAEYWYDLRHKPAMPQAYLNFHQDLENLARSGGNYYRMMLFPYVNDIEFEKLNDYSDRMHVAWEMDQIFEKTEELGLMMHFDLTWANELKEAEESYNKVLWNWYANDYPWVDDDYGYCYMHELGLKERHEFLTSEEALKYYKYKLRYIMSRWGYSTSIALYELMNEINLVFPEHPKEIYKWQVEVAKFIKEDMKSVHLTAVNYAPYPDVEHGDSSYYSEYIDVITFNKYRVSVTRSDFVSDLKRMDHIGKPFIQSEIGFGWGEHDKCEVFSEWSKDAWMSLICGNAGMGLEWFQQRNSELQAAHYLPIKKFIDSVDFREFLWNEADLRKDKQAELIAIKDIEYRRAIGVVHNTTWNYFTNRKNEESVCATDRPSEWFQQYRDVKSKNGRNALKITKMGGLKKYRIEWYDTRTNELITTTIDRSSMAGKIKLVYPELTKVRPMLAFKVYKIKDKKFRPDVRPTITDKPIVQLQEAELKPIPSTEW